MHAAPTLPDINSTRKELQNIYDTIPSVRNTFEQPPIIDSLRLTPSSHSISHSESAHLSYIPNHNSAIIGLNVLRANVKRDMDAIDKYLARYAQGPGVTSHMPAINAPYLIAVWNEIVRASPPLLFVDKSYYPSDESTKTEGIARRTSGKQAKASNSSRKKEGIKVDVVADNGRTWIRVNTIKNSRLLAEFREMDSYITDSDSSSDAGLDHVEHTPSTPGYPFDNSVLRMGRQLLAAATTARSAASSKLSGQPDIILCLTRLIPSRASLTILHEKGAILTNALQHSLGSTDDVPDIEVEGNERITRTVEDLLEMGISVQLGEHDNQIESKTTKCRSIKYPCAHGLGISSSSAMRSTSLTPTKHVNLDLSVLIALVSDISHAPLPASSIEAHARFIPIEKEKERMKSRKLAQKADSSHKTGDRRTDLKRGATRLETEDIDVPADGDGDAFGSTIHSRALTSQALQESELGLMDELAKRLTLLKTPFEDAKNTPECQGLPSVEQSAGLAIPTKFWTTAEVRDRFLRIVASIGGPGERKRAMALFYNSAIDRLLVLPTRQGSDLRTLELDDAQNMFWEDSRHDKGYVPVVPVHVYHAEVGFPSLSVSDGDGDFPTTEFFHALRRTCHRLLEDQPIPHPHDIIAEVDAEESGSSCDHIEEREMRRAAVIRSNPRLTAHTVASLLRGAERGWTTLTANRSSVKEILREMTADGWVPTIRKHHGCEGTVGDTYCDGCGIVREDVGEDRKASSHAPMAKERASLWIIEPRSLAEGMRNDFNP